MQSNVFKMEVYDQNHVNVRSFNLDSIVDITRNKIPNKSQCFRDHKLSTLSKLLSRVNVSEVT